MENPDRTSLSISSDSSGSSLARTSEEPDTQAGKATTVIIIKKEYKILEQDELTITLKAALLSKVMADFLVFQKRVEIEQKALKKLH